MKLYQLKVKLNSLNEFGNDELRYENVTEYVAAKAFLYINTLDKVHAVSRDIIDKAYFLHPNSRDFKEIHMKQF